MLAGLGYEERRETLLALGLISGCFATSGAAGCVRCEPDVLPFRPTGVGTFVGAAKDTEILGQAQRVGAWRRYVTRLARWMEGELRGSIAVVCFAQRDHIDGGSIRDHPVVWLSWAQRG